MMERPYRLSARFVATIDQLGRYGDGRGSGGLSLLVKHTARGHLAKSWAQRISVEGRQRNLGLGSWPHVSLAEAREKCALNLAARRCGGTGDRPQADGPHLRGSCREGGRGAPGWVEGRQQVRDRLAGDPSGLRNAEARPEDQWTGSTRRT